MAGVGFELKKLFQSRTAVGHIRAYTYSAIITAGPFLLLTSMVFLIQTLFGVYDVSIPERNLFLGPVVYVFVFSQLFSSGFTMVQTRYLSDCITTNFLRDVTASLFGLCAVMIGIGSILVIAFFAGSPLPFIDKGLTYLFFLELLIIWVESIYLTAVRHYIRLVMGFAAGLVLAVSTTYMLLNFTDIAPHLAGIAAIDTGLWLLMTIFFVHIVSCFGLPKGGLCFGFLPHFERHWKLGLASFFYTSGLFIPNILVWQGPWREVIADTYVYAPVYDVATFYAFLSILPLMMLFVVISETRFYEHHAAFFAAVTQRGNLREIDHLRHDLLHALWFELRQIVEFQLLFTLIFLAVGDAIFVWSGLPNNSMQMYDVLLFGVFFAGLMQILFVLLTYFDLQISILKTAAASFVGNVIFGLWGLVWGGPDSYGFTFFIAAVIAFAVGWRELTRFTSNLDYYVYCGQPVFYRPPDGPLTHLAQRLGGGNLVDLMSLSPEDRREES